MNERWHERDVSYLTESPARRYATHIGKAITIRALRSRLRYWSRLAPDALAQAETITQKQWAFVRRHRRSEKHAQEVVRLGGNILVPTVMLGVEMVAQGFGAPWGTAFIRCKEEGKIIERPSGLYWKVNEKRS